MIRRFCFVWNENSELDHVQQSLCFEAGLQTERTVTGRCCRRSEGGQPSIYQLVTSAIQGYSMGATPLGEAYHIDRALAARQGIKRYPCGCEKCHGFKTQTVEKHRRKFGRDCKLSEPLLRNPHAQNEDGEDDFDLHGHAPIPADNIIDSPTPGSNVYLQDQTVHDAAICYIFKLAPETRETDLLSEKHVGAKYGRGHT